MLNAVNDGVLPASFLGEGHVHIVVLGGELTFSDGGVIASIRTGEFKLRQ